MTKDSPLVSVMVMLAVEVSTLVLSVERTTWNTSLGSTTASTTSEIVMQETGLALVNCRVPELGP